MLQLLESRVFGQDMQSQKTCFICNSHHHSSLRNKSNATQYQSNASTSSGSHSSARTNTTNTSNTPNSGNGSQVQRQTNAQQKQTVTPTKSNTNQIPTSSSTQVHMTNVNSTHSSSLKNNVLPTVTLDLRYRLSKLSTRAFFDTGSQRSFVSPRIGKCLKLPITEKVPI